MKNSKIDNDKRVGVWMDHHTAHLVNKDSNGDFHIQSFESGHDGIHPDSAKKGFRESEGARHGRQQAALKAYYKTLHTKLKDFNHILICGPTTAKSEFHHHLKKTRGYAGKRIMEMSAPVMTDRQLLAFMKKNLGKPMDIFREEEVV